MCAALAPRRLLVTGATGTLGRELLDVARHQSEVLVRGMSRTGQPPAAGALEWARADLLSDELEPALREVDAIVHLASNKSSSDADVTATRRLLAAAKAGAVRHFVAISIIGCDRIPLPFYATKLALEEAVRTGGVPWSIVRVAQFHSFVARLVAAAATPPIPTPIVADLRFQPVDEREVAERLLEIALGPALGDAPEVAGPEVLTLKEIADLWVARQRRAAALVPVTVATLFSAEPHVSGWARPVLEGYREALNTPRGARTLGRIGFADWLVRRERQ